MAGSALIDLANVNVMRLDNYQMYGRLQHHQVVTAEEWHASYQRCQLPRRHRPGAVCAAGVVFVAFVAWLYRAYANLPGLGDPGPEFARGWAIGAWFVPVLCRSSCTSGGACSSAPT